MNKTFILRSISALLVTGVLIFGFGTAYSPAIAADETSSRKIIVFKEGLGETEKENIINDAGGIKLKGLNLIKAGLVIISSQSVLEKLKANPDVLRIDDDVIVTALGLDFAALEKKVPLLPNWNSNITNSSASKSAKSSALIQVAQNTPWGVDKIDAELVWPSGNTADPIKVAIIDTGISTSHPDLKDNIKGGKNTINNRSYNDDNGHGSHVAGIVVALNNSAGVVGVAPKADLYGVKVLNRYGSGYLSDIIEGIQWSVDNGMQVINMSLGTSSNIQSFSDAVKAAKDAGVVVVAAAGNSGGSVLYPAAYPEVIAVSATDSNNSIANWSSRGPEVDLSAPGVSIYSTYKGFSYATLSGTSMASPHVAGVAALVLNSTVGSYDENSNGKWDPDEVQKKLQDTSIDLGSSGFDNLYGWGLVNAYYAVQ